MGVFSRALVSKPWNGQCIFRKARKPTKPRDMVRELLQDIQRMKPSICDVTYVQQRNSMLLALPTEIRIMFYDELVATCVMEQDDPSAQDYLYTSMAKGHVRCRSIQGSRVYSADHKSLSTTLAGLLQACRQTNHEVTRLVASLNLGLDIDPHFVAVHSFLHRTSADLCSSIRKLYLRYVLPLDVPPIGCDEDYENECLAHRPADYLDLLASRLSSLEEVECIVHSYGGDTGEFFDADIAHQLAMLLRRFQLTTKLYLTRGTSQRSSGAYQVQRVLERISQYMALPPGRLTSG